MEMPIEAVFILKVGHVPHYGVSRQPIMPSPNSGSPSPSKMQNLCHKMAFDTVLTLTLS
jgi:hypothetical protein